MPLSFALSKKDGFDDHCPDCPTRFRRKPDDLTLPFWTAFNQPERNWLVKRR